MLTELSNQKPSSAVDFTIIEATPGMRLVFSPDSPLFTIVSASQDMCRFLGYGKDRLVGKSIFEAFPPNSSDPTFNGHTELLASLELVLKNKMSHRREQRYDLVLNEGLFQETYWDTINTPVLNDDGEVTYIVHTTENITARVIADRKVAENDVAVAQFKFMADNAQNAFILAREDGSFAYVNQKALSGWNYTAEEAKHLRVPDVNPVFNDEVFSAAFKRAQHENIPQFETLHRRKNGEVYPVEINMGALTLAGKPHMFAVARDITNRKRLQEASRKSEENLRNLIMQSPVAMCILNGPDFIVEVANARVLELWGKHADEIMGKPVFDCLPDARVAGLHKIMEQVYSTGERFAANEQPIPLPRNGGLETFYVNFVYEPFRGVDQKIAGVMVVAFDVTNQVVARMKVEESNKELQFVMNVAPQMVWVTYPDGYHALYNYKWYEYTGLSDVESQDTGWTTVVHPDDMERTSAVWKHSLETGEPYEIEYRLKRFDGTYCWFLGRALPLKDETGTILKWFGTCTDIDDQKKASELMEEMVIKRTHELESQKNLLDNILRNSSNGISVTEMIRNDKGDVVDAKTILANDSAIRFVGMPREVFLSKTAVELDPDILTSAYGQKCLHTLVTGEPAVIQYYLGISNRWLELTLSRMDSDHLIHIFTDVTSIKVSQLEQERMLQELKRSNANLEDFAYAASHDLKEPIRKIRFFADRLNNKLSGKLAEEDQHYLMRMDRATERMQLLVDDLLEYSHVSTDNNYVEEIDLGKKLSKVLEDLELEVSRRNASIIVGPLPLIKGHRRQIQQLFQNLITNALKFSKPGVQPEILISASIISGEELITLNAATTPANKAYHQISIVDNGIGFEQEYAERIFKMFQRLHGKAAYEGTGIGLAIVRKVVNNHNGFITAESSPGNGARFTVYLPAN
ncbi:PAS domain S-box protein [Segetibacter sp. 3557_3]|uniref:PAS domain-containing sensor histidine kinase n=1 Tax=Segetibacter sp. 3557_3 TaxID=2547429 RepID=UPI0014048B4D|nr:PAS domain S-box protein [Segetibacter sp. 3557_3]